jgi:predicted  nucleic acid-binding Zn-ribbon protein
MTIERRKYNLELNERVASLEAKLDGVMDRVEEKIGDIRDDVHQMRETSDAIFKLNESRLRFLEDGAIRATENRRALVKFLSGLSLVGGGFAWVITYWDKNNSVLR